MNKNKNFQLKKRSDFENKSYIPEPTLVGRNEDEKINMNDLINDKKNEPKKW